MGFSISSDPNAKVRLLFFYRRNTMCSRYYKTYLKKFKETVFFFDMDTPGEKDIQAAKDFNVVSVPTLILLDKDGRPQLRWVGGIGPDTSLLSIEMGMEKAWWQEKEKKE